MRKFIIMLLTLLGCAIEPIADNVETESEHEFNVPTSNYTHNSNCSKLEKQLIIINNKEYLFKIPALCKENSKINAGDPAPKLIINKQINH